MRLPAPRERRRSTVLGEPFLRVVSTGAKPDTPETEPPQAAETSEPQPLDPFRAMVNLFNACQQADAEIAEIEETLAVDPDALPPESVVAPAQKLLAQTQNDIERLPPGKASEHVIKTAQREGLAVSGRVLEADARARQRFTTGAISDAADRLAARVSEDPAALKPSLKMLNDLIETADLDPSDKRLIKANLEAPVRDAASGRDETAVRGFSADAESLSDPTGAAGSAIGGFRALTEDERAELGTAVQHLRDLGAPDSVVDATLRDLSREVQRRRSTAMDPATGIGLLGGVLITGLVASSLEAQRRRAEQSGATGDGLAMFDRLIDGLQTPADDGGEGDEEDKAQPLASVPDQPIAAAPAAEPPPNPEDDPLFVLMTQTIAGQIVEKGLGESSVVREAVERHAKQLLPKIRDLYPGGIQEEELRRIVPLGSDPAIGDFRPLEVSTAVLLERHLGTKLKRSDRGGDWMDPRTLETYDAILGNIPDPQFYKFRGFVKSLRKHLDKPDVDHIVVDVTPLNEAQKGEVKEYINTELSTDEFKKIMIVE